MSLVGRIFACFIASLSATALARAGDEQPRWQVFADCSAAYRANWQDRLNDPSRRPEMATMIHDESEQYKLAAAGYYQAEKKSSKDEAGRTVEDYVKVNLARFIAMDKAGTLEAYIDHCPQREEQN